MTHDHDLELRPTAAQTEAALNPPPGRNGGDLVVETLAGLGATTVFGLPGQHALGMFDALRRSDLRYIGLRVENNAGFAADAYGRITGEAAPLLLSTGPGALTSLAALQEAAAASAPVLAISSQVIGQGLLVYAIGALPPIVVGLTLLTQPAISAAIGWVAYGEMLQPLDWIGALAIAAALVLVRLPAKGLKPLPEGTS